MKKNKVLIIGIGGMAGSTIFNQLVKNKFDVFGTIHNKDKLQFFKNYSDRINNIDLLNDESLKLFLDKIQPNYIINTTGIIKQSSSINNIELTIHLNSLLPHRLSRLTSAKLFHLSTDCVFDGKKGNYSEHDTDFSSDLYGTSKRVGEPENSNTMICRSSIIGSELNGNFGLFSWLINQKKGSKIDGYDRALFNGITSIEYANILMYIIENNLFTNGIFHIGGDIINKYELLCKINQLLELNLLIEKNSNIEINRTLNTALFNNKFKYKVPNWDSMLFDLKNSMNI